MQQWVNPTHFGQLPSLKMQLKVQFLGQALGVLLEKKYFPPYAENGIKENKALPSSAAVQMTTAAVADDTCGGRGRIER